MSKAKVTICREIEIEVEVAADRDEEGWSYWIEDDPRPSAEDLGLRVVPGTGCSVVLEVVLTEDERREAIELAASE